MMFIKAFMQGVEKKRIKIIKNKSHNCGIFNRLTFTAKLNESFGEICFPLLGRTLL